MSAAVPALEMRNISKAFPGVIALQGAHLVARAGEAVALLGANGAGKSTMMNVLGGVVRLDSGQIRVAGKDVELSGPRDAARAGIAFVHQELTMFDTMTVAENIFLDAFPIRNLKIDTAAMRRRAGELMATLGANFPLDTLVEDLSTGDKQLVEIARALRQDPHIIILDEPTSSLTEPERKRLFSVIGDLKRAGVAVIFITHFLDEIRDSCERVTIMRNGQTVSDTGIDEVTTAEIVHHMLGPTEDVGRFAEPRTVTEAPVVTVRGLSRGGDLHDIDLDLRPGEIVGLWGLLGSGRTELIRALVGLDPIDAGQMTWCRDGKTERLTPLQLKKKAGLVTEDRRGEGIFASLSLADNIALPNLAALMGKFGLVDRKKADALAIDTIGTFNIKASSPRQAIGTLSGGNQQKAVLGRWLARKPEIFFLDEPTRGLDVHAKTEILRVVTQLASEGCAVLIVSSELEELMRVADRYLVISRGRIHSELDGRATSDDLLHAVAS